MINLIGLLIKGSIEVLFLIKKNPTCCTQCGLVRNSVFIVRLGPSEFLENKCFVVAFLFKTNALYEGRTQMKRFVCDE